MDSTPIIAITGQVARHFIGRDAFQETDIIGVTQPITKHNFLVRNIEDLADIVHEAFKLALGGRPGPVLIDVPKDIQIVKALYRPSATVKSLKYYRATRTPELSTAAIAQAAKLINEAQRPVIMAGHGVILSKAYDELRAFAEKVDIPVITTLLGISAFSETHPLSIGMPGMHGPAHVNKAIGMTDVLIGVGLRFDDRVTGKVSEFAPHARIIHIDIDPSEMHKVKVATVPIVADAKTALAALTTAVNPADRRPWIDEIRSWETQNAELANTVIRDQQYPDPPSILEAIRAETNGEAIMGAKMGIPDAHVWAVAGDGGIQMNIQELATLQQQGVAVKVAIMNNGYLGMVRQWQQFFHSRNYSETPITGPDYVKLADAYGLTGMRITRREDVSAAVHKAMETEGTVIIDFVIESESNVYPMVAPGSGITNMIEEHVEEQTRHD
jgi:acetolactate synthase-1/2/3 large subunit